MSLGAYRPEIDGLRAVAVLSVIIFHCDITLFDHRIAPGGFLGVDVFFVISGYLIGRIVMSETAAETFTFAHFYERRARRILPALTVVVLACFPAAWLWMGAPQLANMSASAFATTLFLSNFFFWLDAGYFSESIHFKPLSHTWSLGVEEQFYFLFPPLVVLLTAKRWRLLPSLLALSAASFLAALIIGGYSPDTNFYLFPSRIWELLAGAVLAERELHSGKPSTPLLERLVPPIALTGLLYSFAVFDPKASHPGIGTIVPILSTMALIRCANDGAIHSLLSSRLMAGIGLISYSLYLWHQPLLAFARAYSVNAPAQSEYFALIAASFAFSYLTWRFIEQPFRRRSVSTRTVWRASAISALVLATLGLTGYLARGFPSRSPVLAAAAKVEIGHKNLAGVDCHVSTCIVGDAVKPTIALVGDSHASMLARGLDKALKGSGRSIQVLATGDMYVEKYPRFYESESQFNRILAATKLTLAHSEIETVILAARYTLRIENTPFDNREGGVESLPPTYRGRSAAEMAELLASIDRATRVLIENGKRIILVYPVPETGWHVPTTLGKLALKGALDTISTSYARYKERNTKIISLFDRLPDANVVRIKPDLLLCDTFIPKRCATNQALRIFYFDDDHLSLEGADLVVREIVKHLPGLDR